MASCKHFTEEIPPHIQVVKVVVIGEPKCGKTSFIRAFYDHNDPREIDTCHGVAVYPCKFVIKNEQKMAAIFEIPSDQDFSNGKELAYCDDADAIIFMYAIDDPTSLEMLSEKWLPEAKDIIKSKVIPAALVGTKKDLQEDQQVIERLAANNKRPVSYWEGRALYEKIRGSLNGVAFMECSVNDLLEVYEVFDLIFQYSLSEE